MTVTRAVLPVMRRQGSGLVVALSSTAGISGLGFGSAYAASKFAVEGWIESLAPELPPFGIRTMIVEPGCFRTELLEPASAPTPSCRSTTTPTGRGEPSRPGKA